MRILVLSDIHANLTALEAVLADAGKFDSAWCLGDLVGYGPDPNECLEAVRALPGLVCVLGNHDAAAIGEIDAQAFNPDARLSIEWTRGAVSDENLAFLADIPTHLAVDRVTVVHGSPRAPTHEYLLHPYTATQNFAFFDTEFSFFGHTHIPTVFRLKNGYAELHVLAEPEAFELAPRLMINPGSVGQPRDRDPRAAYAIYDTTGDRWDYRRVAYDVAAVQERMRAHDLPAKHIKRLAEGW
ncbi:MAG TPA: metallophosphoesterase family protein [Anaerolineales bacterium]|nr:metallophosphoesterase family protein [Anaerolineales bacterium]